MELSSKTSYALLALIELAAAYQTGEPLQIRQVAARQDIPDRYLEQLLATLRRGNLVKSQRGAKGGYTLARAPWQITVLDALHCLEGAANTAKDQENKSLSPEMAVIREIWQESHWSAQSILAKYTVKDLLEKRDSRKQRDIMYYI